MKTYIGILRIKPIMAIWRGGQRIQIGPVDTENSTQFWTNNKIFRSYYSPNLFNRPKFLPCPGEDHAVAILASPPLSIYVCIC